MPLKSTFLAFKKKWYKLPKLGGGGGGGGNSGNAQKKIFSYRMASLKVGVAGPNVPKMLALPELIVFRIVQGFFLNWDSQVSVGK